MTKKGSIVSCGGIPATIKIGDYYYELSGCSAPCVDSDGTVYLSTSYFSWDTWDTYTVLLKIEVYGSVSNKTYKVFDDVVAPTYPIVPPVCSKNYVFVMLDVPTGQKIYQIAKSDLSVIRYQDYDFGIEDMMFYKGKLYIASTYKNYSGDCVVEIVPNMTDTEDGTFWSQGMIGTTNHSFKVMPIAQSPANQYVNAPIKVAIINYNALLNGAPEIPDPSNASVDNISVSSGAFRSIIITNGQFEVTFGKDDLAIPKQYEDKYVYIPVKLEKVGHQSTIEYQLADKMTKVASNPTSWMMYFIRRHDLYFVGEANLTDRYDLETMKSLGSSAFTSSWSDVSALYLDSSSNIMNTLKDKNNEVPSSSLINIEDSIKMPSYPSVVYSGKVYSVKTDPKYSFFTILNGTSKQYPTPFKFYKWLNIGSRIPYIKRSIAFIYEGNTITGIRIAMQYTFWEFQQWYIDVYGTSVIPPAPPSCVSNFDFASKISSVQFKILKPEYCLLPPSGSNYGSFEVPETINVSDIIDENAAQNLAEETYISRLPKENCVYVYDPNLIETEIFPNMQLWNTYIVNNVSYSEGFLQVTVECPVNLSDTSSSSITSADYVKIALEKKSPIIGKYIGTVGDKIRVKLLNGNEITVPSHAAAVSGDYVIYRR